MQPQAHETHGQRTCKIPYTCSLRYNTQWPCPPGWLLLSSLTYTITSYRMGLSLPCTSTSSLPFSLSTYENKTKKRAEGGLIYCVHVYIICKSLSYVLIR